MSPDAPPPFRPTPIGVPERGPLRLRPVLIGLAVDWLGTTAASIFVAFVAVAIASARGLDQEGVEQYLEQLAAAPDFVIVSSLIGLGFVALGGCVTALVARRDMLRHAGAMGLASLAVGLGFELFSEPSEAAWRPLWFAVLGHALVLPAALLGGAVAERLRDPGAAPPGAGPLG